MADLVSRSSDRKIPAMTEAFHHDAGMSDFRRQSSCSVMKPGSAKCALRLWRKMSLVIRTQERDVVRAVRLQLMMLLSVVPSALETKRGVHVKPSGDVFYICQNISYNITI